MTDRPKLTLEIAKPLSLEKLSKAPVIGENSFGKYYLYFVKNGSDTEYSFFAPVQVHEKIQDLEAGRRFEITKVASQKGSKVVISYDVVAGQPNTTPPANEVTVAESDHFYELMLQSCRDSMRIQAELGGLLDPKTIAVTLFIARSKTNGYSG